MSVGHDLRTPLTTIRGYAEGLDSGTVGNDDLRITSYNVCYTKLLRLQQALREMDWQEGREEGSSYNFV